MNNSKKSIGKTTAIISIAVALVLSLCTAFTAFSVTAKNSINTELDSSMQTAQKEVNSYNVNFARNTFLFTDKLYSKANVVAATLTEKSSEEDFAKIARNLYLDSIILTDAQGKCEFVYPAEKKIASIDDDSTTRQFSTILKGNLFKSQSEPVLVEGSDNEYSLMTAINRTDKAGLVIIGATVDDYGTLLGNDITDNCNDLTIVAKGDEIISSSFAENDKTKLSELGVDKSKIDGDSFKLNVSGKNYVSKAQTADDFVVLSAVDENCIYSAATTTFVVTIIANVVILLIALLVILLLINRKKKA